MGLNVDARGYHTRFLMGNVMGDRETSMRRDKRELGAFIVQSPVHAGLFGLCYTPLLSELFKLASFRSSSCVPPKNLIRLSSLLNIFSCESMLTDVPP